MAKNDKGRYEREMKDYEPPKGSEGSGKAAGKKAKDPNAPKRASTSYLYFSNEMRPKLKERQPELTFGELGQKLGEMFRKLTPEEKEKYEKLAREDKARFSKETAAYKAKQDGGKNDESDAADSDADGVNEEPDDDEESDDDSDGSD
jgi:HMG (high mobility group) box